MTSREFGSFSLQLVLLLWAAHVCGYVMTRLRQPRVVGEILGGLVLGPSVLGRAFPAAAAVLVPDPASGRQALEYGAVLGFLSHLGLVLLMFASGVETKRLFRRDEWRAIGWLAGVGTGLPFLAAIAASPFIPTESLGGAADNHTALLLVIGIAVAVTSIPVISKIFHDLGILHTRFAGLVLGVAVVEDAVLWGVLAVATSLAASVALPSSGIAAHVAAVLLYFALGLTVLPRVVHWATRAGWNVVARHGPVAWIVTVLFAYTAAASALDVNLVFAAFLAGYALATEPELNDATTTLNKVSFAIFIPLYLAIIGFQLDLTKTFSPRLVLGVLILACGLKLASAGMAARLAGFRWRDSVNLSIALNARGGPGIIVATVAYDAAIINAEFFTALLVLAIATSQAAGAWLDYVIRRGSPLLSEPTTAVISDATARANPRAPGSISPS